MVSYFLYNSINKSLKMNSSNKLSNLSLVHPDETIEQPITPISNMSVDGDFALQNNDYDVSCEDMSDATDDLYLERGKINTNLYYLSPPSSPEPAEIIDTNLLEITRPEFMNKIGDGKMEYIKDQLNREMFTNAWKAITFTDNWDFVGEPIDSFAFSEDPRIYEITEKMEDLGYKGHSGTSFSLTMRSMQYLLQYGEEEFKKMF